MVDAWFQKDLVEILFGCWIDGVQHVSGQRTADPVRDPWVKCDNPKKQDDTEVSS